MKLNYIETNEIRDSDLASVCVVGREVKIERENLSII